MKYFSKIFQQTSWQVAGKVVTSISTFIILGLITRGYGKDGTGVFTLALTYLAMFYLLADFGFNAHVLKKFTTVGSQYTVEWNKLLGTRIAWSVVLIVLAVGLLPFWPFSSFEFTQAVVIGSLAIMASAVFITCNLIFQSKLRYDLSVLASSFGTLTGLAIFVLLISWKIPVPFLFAAHLFGWIVIAFGALILLRRFFSSITPIFNKAYSINLFKQSWPIAATLSLNVLYFRADSFMIAYFKPIADVGIYNVAYAVFQSALVLPAFIMNAYYPMMLQSLEKVKLVGLSLLGFAVVGTFVTIFFAPFIIRTLTGGGFDGSAESLQILSTGFPAYFLSALLMWFLIAQNKYKSMLVIYTLGLVLNVILNFVYIPQYSYIAAAWTTVIAEYIILGMQVMVLFLKRK